jgi:hypothetical protein
MAVLLLCAIACRAKAQGTSELQNRLTLFQNAQNTCKARLLSDPQLAANFVAATKSPLSDVCECAALLTVSNISNKQISAIVSGDKELAVQIANDTWLNFAKCLQIQ